MQCEPQPDKSQSDAYLLTMEAQNWLLLSSTGGLVILGFRKCLG